jgi:uncharacterized protein YneR
MPSFGNNQEDTGDTAKGDCKMKLIVSPEAAKWCKEEMGVREGDSVQLFVKLYGKSIHPNYSLGIIKNETPEDVSLQSSADGVTFYVSEKDAWFFDGYQCTVTARNGELDYLFEPES